MGRLLGNPLHHHAATGMEILAGQPTRLFAYDKGNDIRDVLRRAESFERRGLFADLAEGVTGAGAR